MAFSSRLPAMSLDDRKRVASEAHPALSAPRPSAPSPRAGDPFGRPHPLGMMSAPSGRRSNGSGPASACAKDNPRGTTVENHHASFAAPSRIRDAQLIAVTDRLLNEYGDAPTIAVV